MRPVMASVFQPFQDALSDLVVKPLGMAGQIGSRIRLDVDEDATAYTIRAEIPGARKEDIQVSVEGAEVSLAAEIRPETHDGAGQRSLYRERGYGRIGRSFTLPAEVDSQSATAQYREGVLTLVLPKKAAVAGRRVPIG